VGRERIRIAIVGMGNCASSLVQGVAYYAGREPREAIGLMHFELGGFAPGDIEVVAAFDVDARKVGRDVSEAIFAPPNCTKVFYADVPKAGVPVRMGRVLDGISPHMAEYGPARSFVVADALEADQGEVVRVLREAGTEVLLNYLPVGSERATRFYMECALEAGCAVVNCIPVFIASDPAWARRFEEARLPIIGDDI
jgi:myo-inositol-1-phosphate synthase